MDFYIINVKKLSELLGDERNRYSYTRLKNILNGEIKRTRKGEIKKLRGILKDQFDGMDSKLAKLEEQAF